MNTSGLKSRAVALLAGLALALPASAQGNADDDSAWRESDVPPAPALSTKNMVQIDMPSYSEVMVGVDVDSVVVSSKDGVVRYVTLIQGRDGSLAAYYQGVHCNSFQGRTYARYRFEQPNPGWENVDEPWRELKPKKSRYARLVAQAGACEHYVPAPSTEQARRIYARNDKWRGTQAQGAAATVAPGTQPLAQP